jgi:methionine biosynthesis protein MetW
MRQTLYDVVLAWVPEGARVLDLGTGDGEFLARLVQARHARGEGVERNPELVTRCIERGLVVHQGDVLDGLDQYGAGAVDCVLLLGTFQELLEPQVVLREAFRVGKCVIVSYSNFAHWRARLHLLCRGRAPVTPALPQPWYGTANRHFFSILDFAELCAAMNLRQTRCAYFNQRGRVRWWPNLRAERALSLLEQK